MPENLHLVVSDLNFPGRRAARLKILASGLKILRSLAFQRNQLNFHHKRHTMDLNVYKELKQLIETMTHTGAPSLDQGDVKRVKQICKYVYYVTDN